jgi:hypothetical protein
LHETLEAENIRPDLMNCVPGALEHWGFLTAAGDDDIAK